MVDEPIKKAVVYLDPKEFHSTWIGNKAVYRTRMALADGAELIILAPGVKEFGEDKGIDALIRKYGYRGTPATLKAVNENADLAADLSAAAHLIHASSEGRFTIRWCPGELSRKEIEGVGFEYGDLKAMTARYDPGKLQPWLEPTWAARRSSLWPTQGWVCGRTGAASKARLLLRWRLRTPTDRRVPAPRPDRTTELDRTGRVCVAKD